MIRPNYSSFGFSGAAGVGLQNEYGVHDEFIVLPLHDGALEAVTGMVKYLPEFREAEVNKYAATKPDFSSSMSRMSVDCFYVYIPACACPHTASDVVTLQPSPNRLGFSKCGVPIDGSGFFVRHHG